MLSIPTSQSVLHGYYFIDSMRRASACGSPNAASRKRTVAPMIVQAQRHGVIIKNIYQSSPVGQFGLREKIGRANTDLPNGYKVEFYG